MDIDHGREYALEGQSILFCGAGFSKQAINVRNTEIKDGHKLAQHLANLAGLPSDTSLLDAADEFIEKHGYDQLIKELQGEFTLKDINISHLEVAKTPWKRIYTTGPLAKL